MKKSAPVKTNNAVTDKLSLMKINGNIIRTNSNVIRDMINGNVVSPAPLIAPPIVKSVAIKGIEKAIINKKLAVYV